MAIAYDNATQIAGDSGSHVGTGAELTAIASIIAFGAGSITVTYGGVAMTQVGSKVQLGVSSNYLWVFLLKGAVAGTKTVAITGSDSYQMTVATYTGTDQTSQPDANTSATAAASTNITNALTTIADNCWVIGCAYNSAGSSFSSGTAYTCRGTNGNQTLVGDTNGVVHPAGSQSQTITWNNLGTSIALIQLSLDPSIAPPSPSVSDTVTVSEGITMQLVNLVNRNDTVTITEGITMRLVSFPNVSDTVTITESITITKVSLPNLSDTVTITEGITMRLVYMPSVSDTVTVTDVPTIRVPLLGAINVSDTVTITESVTMMEVLFVNVSDSITVVDVFTPTSVLLIGANPVVNGNFSSQPPYTADTTNTADGTWIDGTANGSTTNDRWRWGTMKTTSGSIAAKFDTVAGKTCMTIAATGLSKVGGAIGQIGISNVAAYTGGTLPGTKQPYLIPALPSTQYLIQGDGYIQSINDPTHLDVGITIVEYDSAFTRLATTSYSFDDSVVGSWQTLFGNLTTNASTAYIAYTVRAQAVGTDASGLNTTFSVTNLYLAQTNSLDLVTHTESVTMTIVDLISVSDAVTVAETITMRLVSLPSISDTVTIAEAVTMQLVQQGSSVFDTVTITENVQMQIVKFISVSDTVTVAENIQMAEAFNFSVSDTITIVESVTLRKILFVNVNDTVSVLESVNLDIRLPISVSDTVSVLENVQVRVIDNQSSSDNITVSESVQMKMVSFINTSDTVVVSEFVVLNINIPTVSDTVTVSEFVSIVIADTPTVFDAITVTEFVSLQIALQIHATEAISVAEFIKIGTKFDVSAFDGTIRLGWRFAPYTLVGDREPSMLVKALQNKNYTIKL